MIALSPLLFWRDFCTGLPRILATTTQRLAKPLCLSLVGRRELWGFELGIQREERKLFTEEEARIPGARTIRDETRSSDNLFASDRAAAR